MDDEVSPVFIAICMMTVATGAILRIAPIVGYVS